jgi:hypothetical protein
MVCMVSVAYGECGVWCVGGVYGECGAWCVCGVCGECGVGVYMPYVVSVVHGVFM